ncbi:peptidoglycan-binding domain-containing protein [Streptomyces sp. NPDC050439]|uniref:peptidoglycan-binding domain-containing protein n=1 Tax=unclassified Streptomyces TaxID=2593676 RepID=UPI00341353F8
MSASNSGPAADEVELGRVLPVAGTCPYSGSHPELTRGRKLTNQDGYFGSDTYSAMRRIQSACGITVDGIVGPKTWKCLHPDQSPNPKYKEGVWPVD